MLNKSLFTAMIKSTGNTGNCGRVPSALLSNQNSVNSQTSNYDYDAIGNVIKDDKQNVAVNNWNVYGKLQSTQKADGTNITYTYDAGGNRISKTVSGTNGYTEWYVRDASGNIMAVYTVTGSDSLYQSEQHLYGSNRIGIFDRNLNADAALPAGISANLIGKYYISSSTRGKKRYEFSDQRGSVLLTTSDKKIPYSSDGTTINYYNADIISATDYSTFGTISRSYNASLATNAFDGQRRSPEISATAQTAQFWEYDGDVGRRWNLDPDIKPYESPYLCFGGNPIYHNDPNGDDYDITTKKDKSGKITNIKVSAKIYIEGDGASAKRAATLTKAAKQVYKTKTVDGIEVSFDVQYVYDPNKKSSELNPKLGENLLTFTKKPENDNVFPRDVSHVNGYLKPFGRYNVETTGNTGEIHNSGKVNYTILHESLHLLGLSDRYSATTGKPYINYKNDIMGVYGKTTLSISHYKNIIEFTKRQNELLLPQYPKLKVIYSDLTLDKKYEDGKTKIKR